jgi:mitotic spindle assembly checkpoint protein MAD2
MASQAVKSKNTISLKGSAAIVADYFKFAVNKCAGRGLTRTRGGGRLMRVPAATPHTTTSSTPHASLAVACPARTHSILYQRGVYPTEEFRPEQQYGLKLLITKNDQLKKYLDTVIKQMSGGRCGCGVCS